MLPDDGLEYVSVYVGLASQQARPQVSQLGGGLDKKVASQPAHLPCYTCSIVQCAGK